MRGAPSAQARRHCIAFRGRASSHYTCYRFSFTISGRRPISTVTDQAYLASRHKTDTASAIHGENTTMSTIFDSRPGGTYNQSRGRGIESETNPLDMAYYDVLGLNDQCTGDDIEKAYRGLAIKVSESSLKPVVCRVMRQL
jgi:hypothetical protein